MIITLLRSTTQINHMGWGMGEGTSGKHWKEQELGNKMVLPRKLAWPLNCGRTLISSSTQWE